MTVRPDTAGVGEVIFDLFAEQMANGHKPDPDCHACHGAGIVRVGHHVWQLCPECGVEALDQPPDQEVQETKGDER